MGFHFLFIVPFIITAGLSATEFGFNSWLYRCFKQIKTLT